jgi:hypothetical protein
MGTQTEEISLHKEKKILIRRSNPDRSQRIRQVVQGLFVALNGWLGVQFYLWVRYFEHGGASFYVPRPAGVEGWLPIAGLMNSKYFLLTGRVPSIHPAAMFLFMAFLLMSLFLKKAFCAWLCPVGTLSEYLWKLGRRVFGRNLRLPRSADLPLQGLKYLLLGFFLCVIGTMSAEALQGFMDTPYGLVADVKMLNFFRDIGLTAAVVVGLLVLLSMLVQNFWCRYLCPYGAVTQKPASIAGIAHAPVQPVFQWTAWCRFVLPNAAPAWFASQPARRRMRFSSPCRRDGPRCLRSAGMEEPSGLSQLRAFSRTSSSDWYFFPGRRTTGRPICPAPCTWTLCPMRTK